MFRVKITIKGGLLRPVRTDRSGPYKRCALFPLRTPHGASGLKSAIRKKNKDLNLLKVAFTEPFAGFFRIPRCHAFLARHRRPQQGKKRQDRQRPEQEWVTEQESEMTHQATTLMRPLQSSIAAEIPLMSRPLTSEQSSARVKQATALSIAVRYLTARHRVSAPLTRALLGNRK